MFARLLSVAVATAFAVPTVAQNPPRVTLQPEKPLPADAPILKKLGENVSPGEIDINASLIEVLAKLSKRSGVTFVVMEEHFKAAKVENIRDGKSPLKRIEAEKLTLRQFLNVWLASIDATIVVRADYVEIVPLAPAKAGTVATPAGKPDPTQALLETLTGQEVKLDDYAHISEVPLLELLNKLSKRYPVNFLINEEMFKAEEYPGDIREAKPRFTATEFRGLSLHHFLTTVLDSMGAAYLVRGGTVEIVPKSHAARLAKSDAGPPSPIVSLIVKEKPLNEVVSLLAERYDLSVVLSPQVGDARTSPVTARLLNVPAGTALEMLAAQWDLRVVRKGNAFLVTGREHAAQLLGEKLEQERQKIELEKFRAAPPPRPRPEPKNGQQPGGVFLLKGAGDLEIPLQIRPEPKPKP